MLKYAAMLLTLITLLVVIYFLYLGKSSQKQAFRHTTVDKLLACPQTPNCVCSEYPEDTKHFVPALDLGELNTDKLASVIEEMGGTIVVQNDTYLSAEFKSGLFGFVDDFELRIDQDSKEIHMRSASRVGRSDLGANKKRLEKFKQALNQT